MAEVEFAPGQRWVRRPGWALAIRVAVVAVPLGVAVPASLAVASALPRPAGIGPTVLWWSALLATSATVSVVGEIVARRLLPLVALLQVSLLFPGQPPSRLALSRGTSRPELRRLSERVQAEGLGADPHQAAITLLRLVVALDQHDRRTRGHSERVRAYTDLLAESLPIDEHGRDRLRWAALLHDIGKLAIPLAVLNKPGKLTQEEWQLIHRHPADGDRMLGGLREWLGEWAPVALQHHERWDGMGYPAGLAGDDICLGARVVSVADAYDVMTSVRSYQRQAKSPGAALAEVVACAGSQFDPQVVRTLVNVNTRKVWLILGPLAWAAQIPLLGPLASPALSGSVAYVGTGAVASVTAAGVSAGGFGELTRTNRGEAPTTVAAAGPETTTTAPAATTTATTTTSGELTTTTLGAGVQPASDPVHPCPAEVTTTVPASTTTTPTPSGTTGDGTPPSTSPPTSPPTADDGTPSLQPDAVSVPSGETVIIDVLANDGEVDPGSLRLASAPTAGAANIAPGGIAYRADEGGDEIITFTYAVEDADGRCAEAEVLVTVSLSD